MERDRRREGNPRIAIIDSNTLAVIGLKQILQTVIPVMQVDAFASLQEMQEKGSDGYYHYFVAMSVVLENRAFFLEHRQQTIVLTHAMHSNVQLSHFHCLCIDVPEKNLIKSLLRLQQGAHAHGKNLPPSPQNMPKNILSDREIEVLSLIVQGYLNKEIAAQLNIGLTTVITHRKNIMEKLGMRSVSALTIYAVMHGYVDINKI